MVSTFATRRSPATTSSDRSLGQLSKILRDSHQDYVMDKLIGFFSGQEDELRDVAGAGRLCIQHPTPSTDLNPRLALKTVAQTIPDKIVPKACAKLGPRLLKQLQNVRPSKKNLLNDLTVSVSPAHHPKQSLKAS